MDKDEKKVKTKNPHNQKVNPSQSTKRFTDTQRKSKESEERSIGGF